MKEKYATIAITGIIAYFTPIITSLLFVGALVMFDWLTGVLKGLKNNELTSRKMIKKFYTGASYLISIAVVRLIEVYFGGEIPMVKPLMAVITLSEIKSMKENIEAITGVDLFANLLSVLQRKAES